MFNFRERLHECIPKNYGNLVLFKLNELAIRFQFFHSQMVIINKFDKHNLKINCIQNKLKIATKNILVLVYIFSIKFVLKIKYLKTE